MSSTRCGSRFDDRRSPVQLVIRVMRAGDEKPLHVSLTQSDDNTNSLLRFLKPLCARSTCCVYRALQQMSCMTYAVLSPTQAPACNTHGRAACRSGRICAQQTRVRRHKRTQQPATPPMPRRQRQQQRQAAPRTPTVTRRPTLGLQSPKQRKLHPKKPPAPRTLARSSRARSAT